MSAESANGELGVRSEAREWEANLSTSEEMRREGVTTLSPVSSEAFGLRQMAAVSGRLMDGTTAEHNTCQ